MFLWNLKKCLGILNRTYLSSDDDWILEQAEMAGAIPIKRPAELCGETPNIPVYQHALQYMNGCNIVVAVQANSPSIDPILIAHTKRMMEFYKFDELMTCHEDYRIYGSIWALSAKKLREYGDAYHPKPQVLLLDPSVDIHTEEDLLKAKEQWKKFLS